MEVMMISSANYAQVFLNSLLCIRMWNFLCYLWCYQMLNLCWK